MIKGKGWPIPPDKAFDVGTISLKNSHRLLKEAKHCFANNQYSTSLALTTLALEELGKHFMVYDAIKSNRTITQDIWKSEFQKHEQKLIKIPNYLRKFSISITEQQAQTFTKMENLVRKLALQKLEALYVDWDSKKGTWYYYDDKPVNEKKSNAKEAIDLADWAIEGYIKETNLGNLVFKTTSEIMSLFEKRKVHAFCNDCGLVMITKSDMKEHQITKPTHKVGFHES